VQVSTLEGPGGASFGRVVQLRDVSAEMLNRREPRTFQTMLSHKLRTPLTHIYATMSILADDAGRMDAGEIAEFAQSSEHHREKRCGT
jgi:signal transduction histidine kinase